MKDSELNWEAIEPIVSGSRVRIRRHRPVNGHSNWLPEMDSFVDRIAVIQRLGGVDEEGCPTVCCSFNGVPCKYRFRVRDLVLLRPTESSFYNLPQDKELSYVDKKRYGPLYIGAHVTIKKHRPVNDECNWCPAMDRFIDKQGVVQMFNGKDNQGCLTVICSFDGEPCSYPFRVRDMRLDDEILNFKP